MPGLRVAVGALLGVVGLLIAMVCLPTAASAAPNITIISAGPDASGDPYDLTVTADDGNGLMIETMTAHVINAGGTDVYDASMAAQSTTNPSAQTWAALTPIPQADLPPGTYTVTVDAMDADETDTGLPTPGFSFSYTSNLTVTMQPQYVTQGSQNVTFTGQLTGSAPGGSATGIADATVLVSGGGGGSQVTTDANGDFSYAATGVVPGSYVFSVGATATYTAASDNVSVPAEPATTSIVNLQASQADVTLGSQNVTFTGTVQMLPPNSQTQVGIGSGVPVYVSVNGATPVVATNTFDASGDFNYTATGIAQTSTFAFSVPETSLYEPTSAAAITIGTQTASTAFSNMTASPAYITYGSQSVTFTGTVQATPGSKAAQGVGSGVPVYLSINGGTANQVTTTDDANGDFSYQVSGLTASGTYTFSVNPTSLYSAATYPVQVNLEPAATSITNLAASPPDIHLGSSTVVFSGTVGVTPFGSTTVTGVGSGVPVYLSVGGATPTQVTTTDDANGDFTYTATGVTQPADYEFSVLGSTFYTAQSQTVAIGLQQLDSTLTATASSPSVTEGAQSITFSGTVTGMLGTDGPQTDIPSAPVDVTVTTSSGSTDLGDVTSTDSNGNFTYTASIPQAATYEFSVGSTAMYTDASASVPIGVVQAQTRITDTSTAPAKPAYGQTATLMGTVQYLNGSTWTALPGATVQVEDAEPIVGSQTIVGSVTSGSDGTFTAGLPTRYGTNWTATVGAATLTQQAQASGNLSVAVPVTVKSFSASLERNDQVSVHGCIEADEPIGYGPQPLIDIEYRASTHGPWSRLGPSLLLDGSPSRGCSGTEESSFSGSIPAKLDNAYYRAYFPANSSRAGFGFESAASKNVHAWMYPTKIISFSIKPTTVSRTRVATMKCRLEQRGSNGKWSPWAGQNVVFMYHLKQDPTEWETDGGPVRTNSSGWAIATQQGGSGNYVFVMVAFYLGDKQHLASHSKGITLTNRNSKSSAILTPADSGLGQLRPSDDGYILLPELFPEKLSLTPLLEG